MKKSNNRNKYFYTFYTFLFRQIQILLENIFGKT